jgi:hypothetical protein
MEQLVDILVRGDKLAFDKVALARKYEPLGMETFARFG